MPAPPESQPQDAPAISRHGLIDQARRHQRRRRQMIGASLVVPIAMGGLLAGLNLSDTGRRAIVVVTPSGPPSSQSPTLGAIPGYLPSTMAPPNVVVLNPATGEVIGASQSEASVAALRAAQSAVAAQSAELTGNGQQGQAAQAQAQVASAQAAAEGAATAAAVAVAATAAAQTRHH